MPRNDAADIKPKRSNRFYVLVGTGITTVAIAIILGIYYSSPSYILTQVWVKGHATFTEAEFVFQGEEWKVSPDRVLFEDVSKHTVFSTRTIQDDGSYTVSLQNGRTYNVMIGYWQGMILHACDAGQVTIDTTSTHYALDVNCHPINDPLNRSDIDVSKY